MIPSISFQLLQYNTLLHQSIVINMPEFFQVDEFFYAAGQNGRHIMTVEPFIVVESKKHIHVWNVNSLSAR